MNALVAEHNWTSWIYISEIIFKIFQSEPYHMDYKLYFELGFLSVGYFTVADLAQLGFSFRS